MESSLLFFGGELSFFAFFEEKMNKSPV